MTNRELFDHIMTNNLKVSKDQLPGLRYRGIKQWDSMTHMDIVSDLEEKFGIEMETMHVLEFDTYEKGMKILSENYGISFDE